MVNNNKIESIKIIKKSANDLFPDCRILLFGSRTKKDHSLDSDYDFLIITKKTIDTLAKREYKAQLRRKLAKYKIPADILIQSEEEIQTKKEIIGHIVREIINEGVAI